MDMEVATGALSGGSPFTVKFKPVVLDTPAESVTESVAVYAPGGKLEVMEQV